MRGLQRVAPGNGDIRHLEEVAESAEAARVRYRPNLDSRAPQLGLSQLGSLDRPGEDNDPASAGWGAEEASRGGSP